MATSSARGHVALGHPVWTSASHAHGTYRVSWGTCGSCWPWGSILAGVSLEIRSVGREAELLAVLKRVLLT